MTAETRLAGWYQMLISYLYIISSSGFFTAKGNLVSSIMYPQPINFRFYQDAAKFLLILGFVGKRLFICLFETSRFTRMSVFPPAFLGTIYSFGVLYQAGVSVALLFCKQRDVWPCSHTVLCLSDAGPADIYEMIGPAHFCLCISRPAGRSWSFGLWTLWPLWCLPRCLQLSPLAPSTHRVDWRNRASSASAHHASTSVASSRSSALTRWDGNHGPRCLALFPHVIHGIVHL